MNSSYIFLNYLDKKKDILDVSFKFYKTYIYDIEQKARNNFSSINVELLNDFNFISKYNNNIKNAENFISQLNLTIYNDFTSNICINSTDISENNSNIIEKEDKNNQTSNKTWKSSVLKVNKIIQIIIFKLLK